MSYYFRERPRFGERFRGKSGDEILQELKQQLDEDAPGLFDNNTTGSTANNTGTTADGSNNAGNTRLPKRDIFDRHTSFPRGFPFDDEGFGRRADIRTHLDDLAARHPEFAEHLIGPCWSDDPFAGTGSIDRRRNGHRRGSAGGFQPNPQQQQQNHQDEDVRSQASGSSAASGGSSGSTGTGGIEPESDYQPKNQQPIPQQYVGNHQQNGMESPQQRNVRSMSAPPENRNNIIGGGQQQNDPNNPQRYISKVEFTPQNQQQQQPQSNNQNQQQQQRERSPAPQQQQQPSNVRQIPIFVEGRDEPVLARGSQDETDFPRRQQSPPHFQRPSHYQQFHKQPPGWSSHFQEPFFDQPAGRWGSPPQHQQYRQQQQQQQPERPRTQQTYYTDAQQPNQRQKPQPRPQQQQQQQQQQVPQQQNETQPETPVKPKQQIQPKDPLEKVALVQQEVDALTEQVRQYTGNSRKDKEYMYLDEMLTRELIKLDDIETEGKDNVRQARKQAIKSIQESISLLESKAPLPGQQLQLQTLEQSQAELSQEMMPINEKPTESIEMEESATIDGSTKAATAAIPLPPPNPSSPIKTIPDVQSTMEEPSKNTQLNDSNIQNQDEVLQQNTQEQAQAETIIITQDANNVSTTPVEKVEENQNIESTDNNVINPQVSNDLVMEVRQSTPPKELQSNTEQQQSQALIVNEQNQEIKDATNTTIPAEEIAVTDEKPKKEPPPVPARPNRSPKKAKKTNKQPEPISETAIPLPAPGQTI